MAMAQPTPRGTLFNLPREIRDFIYDLVLSDRYLVYGEAFWHWDSECHKYPERVSADLSLLHLSKPIREEARRVLFKGSSFRFAILPPTRYENGISRSLYKNKPTRETIFAPSLPLDLTRNMMKIEMIFDMAAWDDCCRIRYPVDDDDMYDMCKSSV